MLRPRLLLRALIFGDGENSPSRAGGDDESDRGVGPKFADRERTCPPRKTLKLFAATPAVPPGAGGPPRGNAPSKLKVLKWESAGLPRGLGDFDFEEAVNSALEHFGKLKPYPLGAEPGTHKASSLRVKRSRGRDKSLCDNDSEESEAKQAAVITKEGD